MNGVCFRCWGSGRDPYTPEELEEWLAKARNEYRARQDELKTTDDERRAAHLRKELELIAVMGKSRKARLAKARKGQPTEAAGRYVSVYLYRAHV
jgi:hypothetical protein